MAYHIWNGKTEDEHKQRVTGFYRIVNELTPDFATALAKMCMNGNKSVARIEAMKYIMLAPEYAAFADKYKSAFANKTYTL